MSCNYVYIHFDNVGNHWNTMKKVKNYKSRHAVETAIEASKNKNIKWDDIKSKIPKWK